LGGFRENPRGNRSKRRRRTMKSKRKKLKRKRRVKKSKRRRLWRRVLKRSTRRLSIKGIRKILRSRIKRIPKNQRSQRRTPITTKTTTNPIVLKAPITSWNTQ
jgi:hypothetical protein